MSNIYERGGKFYASWKQKGEKKRYAMGLDVKGTSSMTARAAKRAAERIATAWKDASTGAITCKQAQDAIAAIPQLPPLVAKNALERVRALAILDAESYLPSIRAYLEAYKGDGKAQSETQRKAAFRKFIAFLGDDADRGLDSLTPEACRAFIRAQLQLVAFGTVKHCKAYVAAAFNRAVHEGFLTRSPFARIELAKMATAINPELGQDRTERQPFTPEEMRLLCTQIAIPWREMVLVSFLTGGQRLGDIACLRWEAVDFEKGLVSFQTGKTGKNINAPMTPALRACLQRLYDERMDAVHVWADMATRYSRSRGVLSVEFVGILRALGIGEAARTPQKGNRRAVSAKSFHSIRHTVVSMLREGGDFSPDVSRAIVGHDSEAVERAYFTASDEVKLRGLDYLSSVL